MKKLKLKQKLNLNKESIANLNEVKGGGSKGSEVDPFTCPTIIIDECMNSKKICIQTYFNCPTEGNVC